MTAPFCIIGTPRSRTAWFARFLTHGEVLCEHEPSKGFRVDSDIVQYFRPNCGAADSMLTLKWRQLFKAKVRLLLIYREKSEVLRSALQAGLPTDTGSRLVLDRIYTEIKLLGPAITTVKYNELTALRCAEIFSWATGTSCTAAWLHHWTTINVQADYSSVLEKAKANSVGLSTFYNLQGTVR